MALKSWPLQSQAVFIDVEKKSNMVNMVMIEEHNRILLNRVHKESGNVSQPLIVELDTTKRTGFNAISINKLIKVQNLRHLEDNYLVLYV